MSNATPEGWCLVPLGDLVRPSKDKARPGSANGRLYLGMEHVESETGRVLGHRDVREVLSTTVAYRTGDVLYGKLRPYLNKVLVAPFDGVGSTEFIVFGQQAHIDSGYLRWLLARRAFVETANERAVGVQLPRVTFDKLADLEQPIAPIAEQRRIVAKVEVLLEQIRRAKDRLDRVQQILKRFRQAVLTAGCSGELTEDWRAANSGERVDSLLLHIHEARQRAGSRGAVPATEDFALNVPSTWAVASMDELTVRITSGSRDWKQYYDDNGTGTFIMAQNVRPLRFDRAYRHGVNPPRNDRDRDRSEIRRGDLLVTIVGANTGDSCRVRDSVSEHYVCQSVALMRPAVEATSAFMELWLNSSLHGLAQYRSWIYGEGRPHLSFNNLKETAVALPPMAEQSVIVRRVEDLFRIADAVEHRIAQATSMADALPQALLAKAFAGDLVPTEADLADTDGRDYETAQQMMDRVHQGQTGLPANLRSGDRLLPCARGVRKVLGTLRKGKRGPRA